MYVYIPDVVGAEVVACRAEEFDVVVFSTDITPVADINSPSIQDTTACLVYMQICGYILTHT